MRQTAAADTTDRDAIATAHPAPARPTVGELWVGRALSGFAVLFLVMDATMKLLELPPAIETTVQLGYEPQVVFWIGVIQAVLLVLYIVPRTSVLGALLWTGYLGGAVATHVRVGSPMLTHALFPVYVAALLWGGLWLRDRRLRPLLPLEKTA